eukprot:Em0023g269a
MPQCCRCNSKGRCRSCDCVKKHIVCTNCLPGRNGTCENTSNESGEDVNISANSATAEEEKQSQYFSKSLIVPPSLEIMLLALKEVRDVLIAKYPPGSPADPSILLHTDEDPTTVHPVLFDRIDAVAIRDAALRTEGAAGPSGIDASDKNPGVRPIGIGEAARRIIAKASTCHQRRHSASSRLTPALCWQLFINIRYLCPSIATVIINTYREPTDLFVDGNSILSQEGTTQGDPLAMPMYALAILPLIRHIADNVQEAWYADDATATGSLKNLRTWWDKLVTVGDSSYGYFVNAVKTWLITKEETHTRALDIFKDTQIRITKEGKPHLEAALGSHMQPLVDHIIKQDETYGYEILQDQLSAKAEVHNPNENSIQMQLRP